MERALAVGTKCSIPRLPETLVRRPRLEALFTNEVRRPVTLVCAPPGAGKTTLLASWLATAPRGPVAWLTVDRRDNESRRLADLVAVALERVGALAGMETPPQSGDDQLDVIFEHLVRQGTGCVLVLDDLHELSSANAMRTVEHLVEQAPPVLDVVLSTRADPPLGWGRLALEGRLRQVRNAELSFRAEEAGELFTRHGVRLGRDDMRALCERTEGWAAGLRLAACALQSDAEPRRFVLSASATQVAVSDYLLTEVLDRQDDASQQFLLRTSVASRLTRDLATVLTGDEGAGARLAGLERRGIFLVELDDDGSYRYHALFGALLRARLRLRNPELYQGLQSLAALWHLTNDMPYEAEEHARAAGDWGLVGSLVLERWVDAVLDGDRPEPDRVGELPAAVVTSTPQLALVTAAHACRRGDRTEAELHRLVVDRAAPPGADPPGLWPTARSLLDVEFGRAFGDVKRSRRALDALENPDQPTAWSPRTRRFAAVRRAELDLSLGREAAARERLESIAADPVDGPWRKEAVAHLAALHALHGRLDEAGAHAVVGGDEGHPEDALFSTHVSEALCAAQRAEPRALADALAAADPVRPAGGPWSVVYDVVRSAHRQGLRRPVEIGGQLAERPLVDHALAALGAPEVMSPKGRTAVTAGPGMLALAAGRRQLAGLPVGPGQDALDPWLDQVADGTAPTSGLRPEAPHPRTVIEANLLSAILADEHDRALSVRRLDAALDLLEATGIRAPFEMYADQVAPLLRRHAAAAGRHLGLTVGLLDRADSGAGGACVVEALTERELEILNHLPTLMSNVEVAESLHLSVNTVKSHLKAIYRKLGVEGRRQAVLRGRELELM